MTTSAGAFNPSAEPGDTLILQREAPSFAWLVTVSGVRRGRLFRLKAAGSKLGRAVDNDIIVDDDAVSRHHARFDAETDTLLPQFWVQDMASANGTFVNGQRISRQLLRDDDRLTIGGLQFVFKQL